MTNAGSPSDFSQRTRYLGVKFLSRPLGTRLPLRQTELVDGSLSLLPRGINLKI